MRLVSLLYHLNLDRSVSEARRLILQGGVRVGGCESGCSFFGTGHCDCGGWSKITDPKFEPTPGSVIKVGPGNWRIVSRINGNPGFDQLPGVAWVPEEATHA